MSPCIHFITVNGRRICAIKERAGKPSEHWCDHECKKRENVDGTSPEKLVEITARNKVVRAQVISTSCSGPSKDVWGPMKWKEFHEWTKTAREDRGWVAKFTRSLPCNDCKTKFKAIIQSSPPDFARLYEWGVNVHNQVNADLGKPIFIPHELESRCSG